MRALTAILTLTAVLVTDIVTACDETCQRRICYFANWAQDGPTTDTKLSAADIDPYLCTHIIYAFANISGNSLAPMQSNDLSSDGVAGGYEKATNLKNGNPKLKVLLTVGGWVLGSDAFHQVADTAASRSEFAANSIRYLRTHKFDGLDIDWEYPGNRGSPPDDKHKFTLLIGELRRAFNAEASGDMRLLLSAAVSSSETIIKSAYEVASISQNLDWINLMTFDFHGSWENTTGQNSPLHNVVHDTGVGATLNVESAAHYWNLHGAPKHKIVIGLALYGRSFTLTSSASGVGAPATVGVSGPYTKEAGTLSYYEICDLINKGATVHFQSDEDVPYLVSGNQWVGYDNENSLREKVKFIKNNGYGGTMVWALHLDDASGKFCGQGKFPLVNAINNECL